MPEFDNISDWIEGAKDGQSHAANQLWQHYFDRLVQTVRQQLLGQNRAISDEEDIVLSVFNSFYAAAQQGRFPELSDRNGLWGLLLSMAARKGIDKRRRDQRQRRGGTHRVQSLHETPETLIETIGNEPSPEMVLMMQESMERFFSHLGVGQLREVAVAKLEGHSNAAIAKRFECSERTIERRLHLIREKCHQEFITDHEHSPQETPDRSPGTDCLYGSI